MGLGKTYSTKYLLDSNNNSGAAGQVLSTTSTGIDWVDANTVPGTGLWLANGNDIYNSNSGNVGIGTTGPDFKLSVAGTVAIGADRSTYIDASEDSSATSHIFTTNDAVGDFSQLAGNLVIQARVHPSVYRDIIFAGGLNTAGPLMTILGEGRVGIGTASPGESLEILKDGGAIIKLHDPGNNSWKIKADSNFHIYDDSNSDYLTILNSGNVGIGTTSPTNKLHVYSGNLDVSGSNAGTGNKILLTTDQNAHYIRANGYWVDVIGNQAEVFRVFGGVGGTSEYLRIDGSGDVGIGTDNPIYKLDVVSAGDGLLSLTGATKPAMIFKVGTAVVGGIQAQANTSLNVSAYGTSSLNLQTAGTTPRLTILTGGNVGIGTTSPGVKLHVHSTSGDGKLRVSGDNILNSGGEIKGFNNGFAFNVAPSGGGTYVERMRINGLGNVGIGDASPTSISANTFSLSVNSSRNDLSGALISKANGTVKHQQYWDSSGYSFNLSAGNFQFNGGNVGIGLTNPTSKLEVTKAASGPVAKFDNTSGTGGTGLEVNGGNGTGFALSVGSYTGSEKFRVQGNGNVGIGTSSPATQLEIYKVNDDPATLRLSSEVQDGDAIAAIISFSNDAGGGGVQGRIENIATEDDTTVFKFYTDNTSSPSMTLFDSGNMTIAGTLTQNSDVRLKENIKPIESALNKVKQMQGVEFNKINSSTKEIGVVAQEIEKIIPELVLEDKEGIKSVAYGNITAVLIEAIKEQQKQIEELKQQLNK